MAEISIENGNRFDGGFPVTELLSKSYSDFYFYEFNDFINGSYTESAWGVAAQYGEYFINGYFFINGLETQNGKIVAGTLLGFGITLDDGVQDWLEDDVEHSLLSVAGLSVDMKNFWEDHVINPTLETKLSSDRSILGGDDDIHSYGPIATDDTIYGYDGNDQITGGGGNDLIDGGAGIDRSVYLANHSNFKLTLGPSSTIMTDRSGAEGTDTLINIEQLAFTDRTLDLDNYSSLTQLNDTQFSDLAKVYVAYFNRAADAEGLYFWADKLAEGMDMKTIASYFSQSAEAKALYPDTADTSAFVIAVYSNVLGRTPDLAGFDFWTTVLNNGTMQPATFVLSIIGGAQGADITYLSNKADLGVYFAAIKGMSDVTDAQNVLNIFGDQATSNTAGAKASVDGHYADATASGGGEFIFELVGIVNDPFAAGI